jgi:hypothetical protein
MNVANSTLGGLRYAFNPPPATLPPGLATSAVGSPQISWDINSTAAYRYTNIYGDTSQYLGERLAGFAKAANGSEGQLFSYDLTRGSATSLSSLGSDQRLRTDLTYDIGYSYVAMGEWSWGVVGRNGDLVPGTDYGNLLFANGDRTPSSGIPVSGTATYDARTLNGWVKAPFALAADFGLRTISTRIDQDYRYNPAGDLLDEPLAIGLHVAGSAAFSNDGVFDIPLTGTLNHGYNTPDTPPSTPITGDMNGAFFGPNAEQVGGTFLLGAGGLRDAFVGQQHQP